RESLDADKIEAIYMALDDEYHALAVYQSVIDTFGPVEPFVEIAASEERHIGALVNQLTKNGLTIPENPWMGNIPPFESLEQACQTSVQAEIDNAALYDQLFSMTDDASLIRVFTNLSNASLNSHLPQFESCQ
ncbi:MAG: ferritin-like domain-containing protein, partial [Anaerolineales bacterium]